jgi:hypothetical protein
MSLLKLKLKAQGLMVLLFFVFTACGKLLPPSGNGVDIPVKIRAVSIAGGAQNETITRASGSERRRVGEPIIQDLGGGMLAEITVEEDLSALRADPTSQRLGDGVKFRIIALNEGTGTIYSWADYTAAGSGTLNPNAGNLHVVSGEEYDFVCFSYNSKTADWPAALSEGGTLGDITVTNANDFLYKKLTTSLSATSNNLSFTLEQQLTKVTLVLKRESRTITDVPGPISLNVADFGSFNLKNGTFDSSPYMTDFSGWTGLNSTEVSSVPLTFIPKTTGGYAFIIQARSLILDGEKRPKVDLTIRSEKFDFMPQRRYTVSITLKQSSTSVKFAGSNIYWNGNELTFDDYGSNSNTKYQGVYFKWGSFVGISPVGIDYDADASTGTVLYWPDDVITHTWKVVRGINWSSIPYEDDRLIKTTDTDACSLLADMDLSAYKGDICNYIKPNYRMPTLDELTTLYSSNGYNPKVSATASVTVPPGDANAAGKYVFADDSYGVFTGTGTSYTLPASGYRSGDSGTSGSAGTYGSYWSGSANGPDQAHELDFNNNDAHKGNYSRSFAQSVRCVLQE